MHIALDQELQVLNANKEFVIKPEEKDYFINSTLSYMINRKTPSSTEGNNYQEFVIDVEELNELDAETDYIPLRIIPGKNRGEITLPSNLLRYVDLVPLVYCGNSNTKVVDWVYATIPFKKDSVSLYDNFKITIDGNEVFNIGNYEAFKNGIKHIYQQYEVLNLIKTELESQGYDVYWETFGANYKANSFFIQGENITTDTNVVFQYKSFNDSATITKIPVSQYDIASTDSSLIESESRLIDREHLSNILKSSMSGTFPESVVVSRFKGLKRIDYSEKFIVPYVKVSYIRIPSIVSVSLNRHCDLSNDTAQKLIAFTAQRIKAVIDGGNYEKVLNENLLIQ